MLQALIEHIANHDHSAWRPLSQTAEVGMIELRLVSISAHKRANQGNRGVKAYRMAFCNIGQNAKPFGSKFLHGAPNLWRWRTLRM
jgi:hypothetical protein